jgi:hypothetical protein
MLVALLVQQPVVISVADMRAFVKDSRRSGCHAVDSRHEIAYHGHDTMTYLLVTV